MARDIRIVNVDGEVCVDFKLLPKKEKSGIRVSPTARKIIKALLEAGSVQSHNKTPESVFRLLTRFDSHTQIFQFIKRRGWQNILSHIKIVR